MTPTKNFYILVVDDTPQNIQLGINILKENPAYSLIFATSGEQALERVKDYSFDLILLDIIMPDLDGYEVCRRLKENPKTRQIPVIFLTARTEQDDIIQGFEVGGVDYITKPFNPQELRARVSTHLKLKHLKEQELKSYDQHLVYLQKMESIGILASGLSHDFNNLLSIMTGISDSIERHLQKQEIDLGELKERFEIIRQSGQRAAQQIGQLIGLADESKNRVSLIDLNEIVDSIHKICSSSFGRNITFTVSKQAGQPLIQGNITQIEQMLLNLLINAKHAMTIMRPESERFSGGELKVSLQPGRPYNSKETWAIKVEDNGVGISEEQQKEIFQPFYSTKSSGSNHGLGLSVVQNVVARHQGRIEIDSVVGEGTTFSVELPAFHTEELTKD